MAKTQSVYWGTDWKGNVVLKGDAIVHDPLQDEVIPSSDLKDYLKEKYGFEFRTAK